MWSVGVFIVCDGFFFFVEFNSLDGKGDYRMIKWVVG